MDPTAFWPSGHALSIEHLLGENARQFFRRLFLLRLNNIDEFSFKWIWKLNHLNTLLQSAPALARILKASNYQSGCLTGWCTSNLDSFRYALCREFLPRLRSKPGMHGFGLLDAYQGMTNYLESSGHLNHSQQYCRYDYYETTCQKSSQKMPDHTLDSHVRRKPLTS